MSRSPSYPVSSIHAETSVSIEHRSSIMSNVSGLLRRGFVGVAIALSVALSVAGCGSPAGGSATGIATDSAAAGSGTGAAGTASDPLGSDSAGTGGDGCGLISDEVASAVLGIEIVRREPHVDATTGGLSCIKGTDRVTDLTQSSYVSVSVTPGGAQYFDQTIQGAQTESVPGVGDRAAFLADAASLIIAAGTDLVTVQVVKGGLPSSLDDCRTVAEDVLANV